MSYFKLEDYEKAKQQQQELRARAAADLLVATDRTNADGAAKSITMSQAMGVPQVVYDQNMEFFDAQFQKKRDEQMLKRSPALTQWLTTAPENLAVAADDLPSLSWWDTTAISAGLVVNQINKLAGGQGNTGGAALTGVPEVVTNLPNDAARGGLNFLAGQAEGQASAFQAAEQDRNRSFSEILADEAKNRQQPQQRQLSELEQRAGMGGLEDALAGTDAPPGLFDVFNASMRWFASRTNEAAGVDNNAQAEGWRRWAAGLLEKAQQFPTSRKYKAGAEILQNAPNSVGGVFGALAEGMYKDPVGVIAFMVGTMAESTPQLAAAVGTTVAAGPLAGAGVMFGTSYATERGASALQFYRDNGIDITTQEGRDKLLADPDLVRKASELGVIRGLVVGFFDALSLGVAGKTLASNPVVDRIAGVITQGLMASAGEYAAQTAAGQQRDWAEIVAEGIVETLTAPFEIWAATREMSIEEARAKKAEANRTFFEALATKSGESKLRQRMPSKFREFVDAATKNGPVSTLWVPADKFAGYWQTQGIDPEQMADAIPGVGADKLAEAMASGSDIAIPTASYAAHMAGSQHDAFFLDNMRLSPEQMTFAEARDFEAAKADLLAKTMEEADRARLQAELEDSIDTKILDRVTTALRAAGVSKVEAETNAQVWPAFFTAMAERSNLTVEELADRIGLPRVEGETPQGMMGLADQTQFTAMMREVRARAAQTAAAPVPQPEATNLTPADIEAIAGDLMSTPAPTDQQRADEIDAIIQYLDELGVDLAQMSDAEIQQRVAGDTRELSGRAADGRKYAQDAVSRGDVTQTEAFKKWFGSSKVVDESGKPMVVYHGTQAKKIEAFDLSKSGNRDGGFYGSGVYLTPDEAVAEEYASSEDGAQGNVISAYVSLQNPFMWDASTEEARARTSEALAALGIKRSPEDINGSDGDALANSDERRKFNAAARAAGYDGVLVFSKYNDTGKPREVLAFDPTQIKSANNFGTFNPNDPRILYQSARPNIGGGTEGGINAEREPAGNGTGRYSLGGQAPLPGAPNVAGASGPDVRLVAVAEQYARDHGLNLRRQAEFVEVDPERARRIADAYAQMPHAPLDPNVQTAYNELIRQTVDQYRALEAAGYKFWFFDENTDPYQGNPWNAMRDLRANQSMAVYATEAGFGSGATALDVSNNPMLADTGIQWPYGAPDGPMKRVLANDLFRAVHDAFGHGIEGAGFRARGEENAWQAHVRLFYGPAVAAITTETRGQNSWLNYGPYGERNRTAAVEDTVFADQKTGLMPEWTWTEGRAGDMPPQLVPGTSPTLNANGMVELQHFSKETRGVIDPAFAGTGPMRGTERGMAGPAKSYYGIDTGKPGGYRRERMLGDVLHTVEIDPSRLYNWFEDPLRLKDGLDRSVTSDQQIAQYEQLIKDAGFAGYWVSQGPNGASAALFEAMPVSRVESAKRPVPPQFLKKQPKTLFQRDVLRRTPELQDAARKVAAGEMTAEEYTALVQRYKPVEPYTAVPEPASLEDMRRALTSDKVDRIGSPDALEAGHKVGLRLDIPAYANHGVWVVSVHEQQSGFGAGPSIGYASVARASNVTMGVVERAALSIAQGKPKGTIATMKGDWVPTTPEEAKAIADAALADPSWRQVGMDPERASFFYDRETMQPITAADEVIQIGPLVLAKNPQYANRGNFLFQSAVTETQAFRDWFGDSKAVDANGKPQRFFTGTSKDKDFTSFKVGRHGGWFTTDPAVASQYAVDNDSMDLKYDGRQFNRVNTASRVIPAYLRIENPFRGDKPEWVMTQQNYKKAQSDWFDVLRSQGYDGWMPDSDPSLAVVLKEPTQIKGVFNGGNFDPKKANMLMQDRSTFGPRGSIEFSAGGLGKGETVIRLFRSRDLSTFMHESGHFFLSALQLLSQDPSITPEITEMYATVERWWGENAAAVARDGTRATGTAITAEDVRAALQNGTTGDQEKDIAIDVGMQEQWARAFEAYLMEGKAPSVQLRSVFERFRSWLLAVYRSISGLNVEVSDEIRSVFDRMLATDRQIAEASKQSGFEMMAEADAQKAGISPEDYAKLRDLHAAVLEEASARVLADTMRPIRQQQEAWYREERTKTEAEVRERLAAEPVYRAINALRFGKDASGEVIEPPIKLSREAIATAYDKRFLTSLPGMTKTGGNHRFSVMANEGGYPPDVAAEMFGFASGQSLLEALERAPRFEDAVKAEVEKIMFERHGDPLRDGTVEMTALEEMHGDKKARYLEEELRLLTQPAGKGPKATMAAEVKAIARQTLSRMLVKDARRASRFLTAERKAGAEALSAIARGDREAAVIAKRRQLLNHHLYREASKIDEEIEKIQTKTKRQFKGSDEKLAKTRDINYVKAARAIAARFNLAAADSDFDFAMWMEQLRFEDPVSADAIYQAVDAYSQDAKPYTDLSVERLRGVAAAIDSVLEVGKMSRQLEIDGKKVERADALAALVPIANDRARPNPLVKDSIKVRFLSMVAGLRRVADWARDMDNGQLGPFTRYLVKPITDAVARYKEDRAVRLKELLDIINERKADLFGKAIIAPEIGHTFANKGELIHALLHTGNESNMRKLLLGYGWAMENYWKPGGGKKSLATNRWDAFIARSHADGTITKEDWDMVQKIWDLLEATKRPAQATHKRIYGFYFNEVEATPVTTPFGTYKGGYVPAIVDKFLTAEGDIRASEDSENMPATAMFPTTGSGFTKSRVENYAAKLELNLMLLPAHLDKVLRFTHLEPIVRQTGSLLRDRAIAEPLKAQNPAILNTMLFPWLQRVAQQAVEQPAQTDAGRQMAKLFRTMRSRVGIATMFGNIVNTLQQVAGFSTALTVVRPSHLKSAMFRFMSDATGMRDQMRAASPFMRERGTNQQREILNRIEEAVVKPGNLAAMQDWFMRHGYFMQQAMQNFMDPIIWHAAYDQAITNGQTADEAVFEADQAVQRTQSDNSPEVLSTFETSTAFARLFTMFYSYFGAQANLLGTELSVAIRNSTGWGGAKKAFWIYAVGIMIPALVSEAIVQAFNGGLEDEDDDGYADEILSLFFGAQARYMLAMAPVVSNITNSIVGQFTDAFYDDRVSTSPVISAVERAVRAPKSVANAIEDPDRAPRAVSDGLYTLGLILGVPAGQLAKTVGYATSVAVGRSDPQSVADVAQGAVSGRDGTER